MMPFVRSFAQRARERGRLHAVSQGGSSGYAHPANESPILAASSSDLVGSWVYQGGAFTNDDHLGGTRCLKTNGGLTAPFTRPTNARARGIGARAALSYILTPNARAHARGVDPVNSSHEKSRTLALLGLWLKRGGGSDPTFP